jgi:hypothetical protein
MRHRTRMASACCNVKESLEVFCEASPQHCNQDLAPGCDFGGKDQPAGRHPSAPDDVRAHAGESAPQSLAPGLIEEAVSRFALPWSLSLTRDSGWLSNNVETLVEELETEAETLWQMGALAFATLQRIAHDQAELLESTIASAPTDDPCLPPRCDWGSPKSRAFMARTTVSALLCSLDEIVDVLGESHRELTDIHIERMTMLATAFSLLFERR